MAEETVLTREPSNLEPRGEGYCPLETAYGHGGPTRYCQNESHGDDGWCLDHLIEWGYADEADCDGACIARPHVYRYGSGKYLSAVCQRNGCNVMGTGDRCGDGECEGRDRPSVQSTMEDLAALLRGTS